jgi:O-antigen ligase
VAAAQRVALHTLLLGVLAAFGGIYPWATLWIVGGACAVLLLRGRGARAAIPADVRPLVRAWILVAAAVAVQLVPLPTALRTSVSPALAPLEATLRPDALVRSPGAEPLSLAPRETRHAFGIAAAAGLTYVAALVVFSCGGVRQATRVLAVAAVVVSIGALVQRALSPDLIYGYWRPEAPGAQPFGPVVNRNHLVAWLVMSGSLVSGYMVARLRTRLDGPLTGAPWRYVTRHMADSKTLGLAVVWGVVAVTVSLAQSRSGWLALLVSLAVLWRGAARSPWHAREAVVVGALLIAGLGLAVMLGDAGTLASRFLQALDGGEVGRRVIWRETWPLVGDFWLTGTGAGAFGVAMTAYQQTRPLVPHLGSLVGHFNHAHNHYLQVAAEGGLLVGAPAVGAVLRFATLARRRLEAEKGELRWIRLGALGGLAGVAVQSLWEVPLTMPANALLAATLAAIVTCQRSGDPHVRGGVGR